MALLLMQGFDSTIPDRGVVLSAGATQVGGTLRVAGGSGSKSARFPIAPTLGPIYAGIRVTCAVAVYAEAIFSFKNAALATIAQVRPDPNTGTVSVLRGATVVATSTATFNWTATHHVEAMLHADGTGGTIKVRVDGVEVVSFTGNTAGAAGPIAYISCENAGSTAGSRTFDDLVVLDDTGPAPLNRWPGPLVVSTIRPASDAGPNAWTPSTPGPHADLVDDDSTLDYVGAGTASTGRDMWRLAALPSPAVDVYAVQTATLMQASDAGAAPAVSAVVAGPGGEVVTPLGAPIQSADLVPGAILATQPGGTPWTPAAVNALLTGVEA